MQNVYKKKLGICQFSTGGIPFKYHTYLILMTFLIEFLHLNFFLIKAVFRNETINLFNTHLVKYIFYMSKRDSACILNPLSEK